MTTSLQAPTTGPLGATGEVANRFWKKLFLGILVVLVVFFIAYALAWVNAYRLSNRFFTDANNTYNGGDYLKSLVGYQDFDAKTNKYINYGGFVSVEKIWSSNYSWPVPNFVQLSRQRSQEIIQKKLTVEEAEQYIRDNTGRPGAPYFGEIYLRLGELYEQQGDYKDARDVYQSMASLFPDRKDLIQIAQKHLDQLQSQGK